MKKIVWRVITSLDTYSYWPGDPTVVINDYKTKKEAIMYAETNSRIYRVKGNKSERIENCKGVK